MIIRDKDEFKIEEIELMVVHSDDFQNMNFRSKRYNRINELIVAEDVSEIPSRAFTLFLATKKIKILGELKRLDSTLFENCFELEEIYLPKSLEVISTEAFFNGTRIYAPKDSYADIYGRYLTSGVVKTVDDDIIQRIFSMVQGKELIHDIPAKAHIEIDGITLETAMIYAKDESLNVKCIFNGEETNITDPSFIQRLKEVAAYEYYNGENLESALDCLLYVCKGLNLLFSISCKNALSLNALLNDVVMRHRIFNLIAVALGWGFDSWTEKEKVNVFLKGLQTKNGNIKKSMTQEHCTEKGTIPKI